MKFRWWSGRVGRWFCTPNYSSSYRTVILIENRNTAFLTKRMETIHSLRELKSFSLRPSVAMVGTCPPLVERAHPNGSSELTMENLAGTFTWFVSRTGPSHMNFAQLDDSIMMMPNVDAQLFQCNTQAGHELNDQNGSPVKRFVLWQN